ncbi:MAG: oxidoreductase [Actinomycetes bacterium]
MRWFRRRSRPGTLRTADQGDTRHLEEFARSRQGVEAFVEPRTTVTETTVVFVATTGEWTRRRVAGPRAAHDLAGKLGIPCYDAAVVGYPQRMREWNRRQQSS